MMSGDPSWNLNYTARRDIATRWLEEEEWFLRQYIFQFLDVVRVVTPYSDYLCSG